MLYRLIHQIAQYLHGPGGILVALAVVAIAMVWSAREALRAGRDVAQLGFEARALLGARLLSPIARQVMPRTEPEIRELRLRLLRAGFRSENALRNFTLVRTFAFLATAFVGIGLFLSDVSMESLLLMILAYIYAAIRLPDLWIDRRIEQRKSRIALALPSMIDLMVLCLDVGLIVEAAFGRVAQEMRSFEPILAEEADIMLVEINAGLAFPKALKRLADRVGLDDLTTLANLISQAAALGASVGKTLRDYSEASFTKRLFSLEEFAGKISGQLTLPITVCFLPAALLSFAAPAIIDAVNNFG